MNPLIVIALIGAIPPTIVAVLALIASIRNGRAIQEVHVSINSRMTELLAATKAASTAEGHAQGQEDANARTDKLNGSL